MTTEYNSYARALESDRFHSHQDLDDCIAEDKIRTLQRRVEILEAALRNLQTIPIYDSNGKFISFGPTLRAAQNTNGRKRTNEKPTW